MFLSTWAFWGRYERPYVRLGACHTSGLLEAGAVRDVVIQRRKAVGVELFWLHLVGWDDERRGQMDVHGCISNQ